MELAGIMPSEINQTKKNAVWFHLHVESKEKINKETKHKQIHRYREYFDGCQMGGGLEGWVKKGEGIKYKLLVTE